MCPSESCIAKNVSWTLATLIVIPILMKDCRLSELLVFISCRGTRFYERSILILTPVLDLTGKAVRLTGFFLGIQVQNLYGLVCRYRYPDDHGIEAKPGAIRGP